MTNEIIKAMQGKKENKIRKWWNKNDNVSFGPKVYQIGHVGPGARGVAPGFSV